MESLENRIEALCEAERNRQAAEWREVILRQCEQWDRTVVYEAGCEQGPCDE